MPNPTRGDVHVNRPLTNISIGYFQSESGFVASRVFPNIPVSSKSDSYYEYDRGSFNRDEAKKRAPGDESAGGGYDISTSTYSTEVYAFHKDVPDQIRANADNPLRPDQEATIYVTQKMLLKREKVFVTNYFAGGIWSYDYDGNATGPTGSTNEVYQWSDYTNGTPIEDVRDGATSVQESTGFRPNVLVLGRRVYDTLLDHPDIVDRIKYGQSSGNVAMVNKQILANLFDIPRVEVMEAIENTAKEGQTAAHSFIGGKKAMLVYAAPNPGVMTPSAGYTFSWTGYLGATQDGARIKRFRCEKEAADRVEGEIAFDLKLVGADLGAFWDTIVA